MCPVQRGSTVYMLGLPAYVIKTRSLSQVTISGHSSAYQLAIIQLNRRTTFVVMSEE